MGALIELASPVVGPGSGPPLFPAHRVSLSGRVLSSFLSCDFTWSSELGAAASGSYVPLVGSTLSRAFAYRWITALRLEFAAGIPISNAVADAWRASGYAYRGERLAIEGEAAIRDGTELSALVQKWGQLPRDWIDFIETGEISGAFETAFVNRNRSRPVVAAGRAAPERVAAEDPLSDRYFDHRGRQIGSDPQKAAVALDTDAEICHR